MIKYQLATDAAAGNSAAVTDTLPRQFGDKRDVGRMAGMSPRWVSDQMARGMPHLKLGPRRCRFDLGEVAAWLRETYRVQRRGGVR